MSQQKSSRPTPPTLAQAAKVRPRYLAGARLGDLAREMGCWRDDLRRLFAALGCLRDEDRLPRRCRICAAPVRSGSGRDLCAAHVRQFCSRCEAPLPEGRVNRWCYRCEQERKPADYALRRLVALRVPGECRRCHAPLPPGRIDPRCPACASAYRRQKRQQRRRRDAHRCVMCGDPLPLARISYCGGCDGMLDKWRRAWHRGNPIARRLGTVETRKRWQEKSA
jgi:hypothetical protein